MSRPAPTRDAILALLAHYTEGLTKDEISIELGIHEGAIESCIRYERQKTGSTVLRIDHYKPMRGKGGRPQAVYVIGPGEDASRPDLGTIKHERARKTRYRESHRALINARLRATRGGTDNSNPFSQLIWLSQRSAASNTTQARA